MIRATVIVALAVVLALALYLPAAFAPLHFLTRLKSEYESTARVWGPEVAAASLEAALGLQETTRAATPAMNHAPPIAGDVFDTAVSREMASVNRRLFDNAYFRSIEALLLLAAFRLCSLGHALPWLAPFVAVALVDGQVIRLRKAREFGRHDPELFALAMAAAILTACGTLAALLAPVSLPAWLWMGAPLLTGWLLSRALACFHRRT